MGSSSHLVTLLMRIGEDHHEQVQMMAAVGCQTMMTWKTMMMGQEVEGHDRLITRMAKQEG